MEPDIDDQISAIAASLAAMSNDDDDDDDDDDGDGLCSSFVSWCCR